MPALSLSPLRFTPAETAEVVDLYASNPEYARAAGEHDPESILAELREEAATDGCEVLLARDEESGGRVSALLCLLDRHPKDGLPWIGLLLVHGGLRRRGIGRELVDVVERRFRAEGREGIRLAVLENHAPALAFWTSLGWHEIDRRRDVQHDRPCIVLHKPLA
ncbi:GNAT family N-acetyltransferase [Streptomyces sp. NPDC020681]|uniref:GNAT family N-acetyltransferase n=1 Tax=Streptomyces sp. NPDC020681 TaxID=3365083 RepID=UPI0037A49BFA